MTLRDVRLACALVVFALLGGCSSGTEAPVATSVTITPGQLTFGQLNQSLALAARVTDQRGDSMTGQAVTWSSNNTAVATVNPTTGSVTSVANGTATITATSGSAMGNITATVNQLASGAAKVGDAQQGTVGAALPFAISVHVTDNGGAPIANRAVTFAVTGGGGSLANVSATTNVTGDAQANWTLGTVAGAPQSVTATIGTLVATFTATALAGAASAVTIQAGNNQTRVVNAEVTIDPSVRVSDSFGNAKPGVTVTFTPTAGGGSVVGGTPTTNANGIATVTSWTMGGSAGTNTLQAAVQGTALTVNFTATAVAAGAPTNIAVLAGNAQTALVGYPTNIRPAVLVTDAGGQPVAGVTVDFAVTGGGGSVTSSSVMTNAVGIAQVGNWTVGGVAGANTMTATAAPGGITNNPVTFTATGQASGFNIVIQNYGPAFNSATQAAFDSAIAFWRRVIIGDIADGSLGNGSQFPAGTCGPGTPSLSGNVDDLLILAKFDAIDGQFGTLGRAFPCLFRTGTNAPLTAVGVMEFDSVDMATLSAQNLAYVIRHEMGHVLGFGTLFNDSPLACRANTVTGASGPLDTHFTCTNGRAVFDSIGGTNYTGGLKVPLENCGPATFAGLPPGTPCGQGNYNSHWREPTFFTELMTPYLNSGAPANPLSVLSIAALQDMGYLVNYGAAEAYSQPFTAPEWLTSSMRSGPVISLENDIIRLPMRGIDASGRVTRVIQP